MEINYRINNNQWRSYDNYMDESKYLEKTYGKIVKTKIIGYNRNIFTVKVVTDKDLTLQLKTGHNYNNHYDAFGDWIDHLAAGLVYINVKRTVKTSKPIKTLKINMPEFC